MTLWERIRTFLEDQTHGLKMRGAERGEHERLVEQAIERVVDHTNPRLRALPGYRRKLFDAVAHSLDYCTEVANRIPGPVMVDRKTWASDPLVNSLFGSAESLRWGLTSKAVRHYVKETAVEAGDCYAVLLAVPQVRTQLGIEVRGDFIRHDVKQTTLNFANHEVVLPAGDPQTVRREAASAIMDTLVGVAVTEIAEQEGRIAELEERERIVCIKRKSLAPTGRALDLMGSEAGARLEELAALDKRLAELKKDLADARVGLATLDDYLERLRGMLVHPEVHIGAKLERVRLDRMNVVRYVGDEDPEDGVEIELFRGYRSDRPGRILLLARFPRGELVDDDERAAEIERYVNA
jgi:hypothetical protein